MSLLCSVRAAADTVQLCTVLDKVVDLPVIVQVQEMVQIVQILCSSWTRLVTPVVVLSRKLWKFCSRSSHTGGDMPVVATSGLEVQLLSKLVHARCFDDRSIAAGAGPADMDVPVNMQRQVV